MGRSVTPKYRIEAEDGSSWKACWRGRASAKALAEYVEAVNKSMLPGGANAHVSKHRGFVVVINHARIVEQKTGRIVAEYKAPLFQAI